MCKFEIGDYVVCVKPKSVVNEHYDLIENEIYVVDETVGKNHYGIRIQGSDIFYSASRFIKHEPQIEDDVGVDFF